MHSIEQSLKELYMAFYAEYTEYGKEVMDYFDWCGHADSEYLKQEFLKCASSNKTKLPQSIIDGYETDCLRRNLSNT